MRFNLGPVPDEFTPDGTWRPIREPGPIVMQFLALPLGLGIASVVGYGWHRVGMPASLQFQFRYAGVFVLAMLLLVITVLPLVMAACGLKPAPLTW